MANENKAVVDETKGPAVPDAAGTDARKADDLDALLNEFTSTTARPAEATKPDTKTDTTAKTDAEKRLDALERELAAERSQKAIKPVVDKVRGDIPASVLSDDEIVDLLDGRAQRDPRIASAWANRHTNPKAFDKVVDALSREIAGKFSKLPDRAATEDREAVTAAVRGASTKAPEGAPPKFGDLSNSDFNKSVQEKYGFNPGV